MPELPEVETTVRGLDRVLRGRTVADVWSDYDSPFHAGKDNIKNRSFFTTFRNFVIGQKVRSVSRRAKNILIHLENKKTVLIHMKMTGHLLYGQYVRVKPKMRRDLEDPHGWEHETWIPSELANDPKTPSLLADPFNKFIHFVISLDNGKHIAFSDMRKFAKVTVLDSDALDRSADLAEIGPEPMTDHFTAQEFAARVKTRPNAMIKQVLMDQKVLAGIGNIYSDEILWGAGVHPKSIVGNIPERYFAAMYAVMKEILGRSIALGGDSMSDYRNLAGEKGGFHPYHNAYMQHGKACAKKGCGNAKKPSIIVKIKIGTRSAHFCPVHQRYFR